MRDRSRKGAHVVETALVLLPFVFTLIGVLDFGQLLFFYQTFRARAHSGARYAAVNPYNSQTIANVVAYGATTGSGKGRFGLTPSMVTVTRYDQGTAYDRIEVKINYPLAFISPLLAKYKLTPVFRSVMPVESLGATN